MMLADAVGTTPDGGMVIFGPGWIVRPPSAALAGQAAVAFVVRVPRDQTGAHQLRLELLDSEDEIVVIPPPDGPGPMIYEVDFEADGLAEPAAVPLTARLAVSLPAFPLARGSAFRWRAYIDGETRDPWVLPFRTSPPRSPTPVARKQ